MLVEVFNKFLDENNCKEEFYQNYKQYIDAPSFIKIKKEFAIVEAFSFDDSKWHDISDKWIKEYKKYIKLKNKEK